ncbi:hypothetical protein R1flu_008868 [Riccia fluitans]|uniref:Uncharacterized protein n=1 Tax=Riccia fluitans TaxID=41844 RepID=A0ABD1Z0Z3_9MARC
MPKKEETSMDELLKGMRDLSIKFSRLKDKKIGGEGRFGTRQAWIQRCIWCDAQEHVRRDCEDFQENLWQGVIFWKEGEIALRDTRDVLQPNFGKGGMKKIVNDFQATHVVAAVEATSYGARASHVSRGELASDGYVEPTKSQYEALVEEKRRREDAREGTSTKRQTRLEKSGQEPLPADVVMEETPRQAEKGKELMKEKVKGPNYKLQSDIEAATDLKEIFEEQIRNSKIEFTLCQILGIAKREFHDVIKRKRHMTGEMEQVTVHVMDSVVSKEEEEEIATCCQQNTDKEKHVRFVDEVVEDGVVNPSHFTRNHWARAIGEALVKLENLEELVVALIDHGSNENVYEKGKWPIGTNHNWMIRVANSSFGKLFGACADIKVKIGDVVVEQNMFVQETTSYPMVLGQPFIIVVRMERKVMDDGSAYSRIHSKDGQHTVQFLTILVNHERNKDQLRRKPLPRPSEEFRDF